MGNPGSSFVDIVARKPGGWLGKALYRDPKGHYKSFNLALEKLALKPDDAYLEIGCGGGVLLEMALETAAMARAIDLSPDMVRMAQERNREAVSRGRAQIVEGNAHELPWDDETFTCAASANMFFFVAEPSKALKEIFRVLKPGGRLVITTHPKSPWFWIFAKPFSMSLYTGAEMESMMRAAGFSLTRAKTVGMVHQVCYAVK